MRYLKKGLKAPVFSLTKTFLHTLYEKQNGLGFYSHIPLALQPFSHWTASLERLDPDRDYVHDNVVLDACEFNNRCQWSINKVIQIPSLILAPCNADLHDLNHARVQPQRKPRRKILMENNAINAYYCFDCDDWKDVDFFYKSNIHRCRSCLIKYVLVKNNTLRGHMKLLWRNAKQTSKQKISSHD
eukprot:278644_1